MQKILRVKGLSRGSGKNKIPLNQRARPTRERLDKSEGDFERGDTGQLTMRDSPLERALSRKMITDEEYAAGQKYRHHWYHAGLCDPLASMDLAHIFASNHGGSSGMAKSETQQFHRQR